MLLSLVIQHYTFSTFYFHKLYCKKHCYAYCKKTVFLSCKFNIQFKVRFKLIGLLLNKKQIKL